MPETTNVESATEENLNQDCGCGCSSVGAGNSDCGAVVAAETRVAQIGKN